MRSNTSHAGRQPWRAWPWGSRPRVAGRQSLWSRAPVRRIGSGIIALLMVMCYGTAGYMLMDWTFMDSFYQVFITISAVGLTEVHPLETTPLRLHTMLVIALGLLSVAYTVGGFVTLLTEGEFQKHLGLQRMRKQIETLRGHTIVAGFGRVGALVCEGLATSGGSFVIIEQDHERAPDMAALGYHHLFGDATEEAILKEAGIERASVLVTSMPNDAANVFITLTARELSPRIQIIARAEQPSTQKKLKQAGADHVIMPAVIGAHRIVSLLTNPTAVEFIELVTERSSLAIEMDDIPIRDESPLAGHTLRDLNIGRRTGVIVVAVKRSDGVVEFPPAGDQAFQTGRQHRAAGEADEPESVPRRVQGVIRSVRERLTKRVVRPRMTRRHRSTNNLDGESLLDSMRQEVKHAMDGVDPRCYSNDWMWRVRLWRSQRGQEVRPGIQRRQ